MKILSRLFKFDIDSYIVFKESINDIEEKHFFSGNGLWEGKYRLIPVDINNKDELCKLTVLWCKAYVSCPSTTDAERTIKKMYSNGSLCFVSIQDEAYVGMLWLGDNSNFMFNRIGSFLLQETRKSVYHHIYVMPEARGFNLQGGLRLLALQWARKCDIDEVYAFVGCKNFSSIKNFLEFSNCYRLIYHISLDIGSLRLNFHPKLAIEKWVFLNRTN